MGVHAIMRDKGLLSFVNVMSNTEKRNTEKTSNSLKKRENNVKNEIIIDIVFERIKEKCEKEIR